MTITNQPVPTPTGAINPIMSAIDTHNMESLPTVNPLSQAYLRTNQSVNPFGRFHEFIRQVLSKDSPGFRNLREEERRQAYRTALPR